MSTPTAKFTKTVPTLILTIQWLSPPLTTLLVIFFSLWFYDITFGEKYFVLGVISLLVATIVFKDSELNSSSTKITKTKTARLIIVNWLLTLGIIMGSVYFAGFTGRYPPKVLILWSTLTPLVILSVFFITQLLLNQLLETDRYMRVGVITGASEVGIELATQINSNPQYGVRIAGFFEDRKQGRIDDIKLPEGLKLLGTIDELAAYAKDNGIDVNFIALPYLKDRRIVSLVDAMKDTTSSLYYVPDLNLSEQLGPYVDSINGIPVYALSETPIKGVNALTKRLFDLSLALVALIILSPVMLVIALMIKLTSQGEVIFRQTRYGLDGKEFKLYKFRSMNVSENGPCIVQATKNDPRITRLGSFLRRTSLDELPQLFNVLTGTMSIVGPRPHAVAHNEEYRKIINGYMVRHKVKPGITGWAQVNGLRGETKQIEQMSRRIKCDLDYIRNWSVTFDIKIIFLTIWVLIKQENAH